MAMNEYRRHAAECLAIADDTTTNPNNKILLIAMAQAWLRLAQQAERNDATGMAHQPPPSPEVSAPPKVATI
jgi:hypothetical protein